jgi:hypothetical protein
MVSAMIRIWIFESTKFMAIDFILQLRKSYMSIMLNYFVPGSSYAPIGVPRKLIHASVIDA